MNSLLVNLVYLARAVGILLMHLLIPGTNITSIAASYGIYTYSDILRSVPFIFCATFIIDTLLSTSLGSYSFAWLVTIVPMLFLKLMSQRLYEPKISSLKVISECAWLVTTALLHAFVTQLLNGRVMYPSISDALLTLVTAFVVMMLNKSARL